MAFASQAQARLLLGPHHVRGLNDDAAGFTSCCGLAGCDIPTGCSSLRFDTGFSTDAGSPATEDPGISPDRTFTGWLS
jgi:hypothetical protein